MRQQEVPSGAPTLDPQSVDSYRDSKELECAIIIQGHAFVQIYHVHPIVYRSVLKECKSGSKEKTAAIQSHRKWKYITK